MSIHDGHRERLTERYLTYGLDALEEHEVLEMLLFYVIHRKDTNPIAHALIRRFGSLANVMDASIKELLEIDGIGKKAAILLQLAKPMCRRYLISQAKDISKLDTLEACVDYLRPHFFGAKDEHVLLLCLDAKCRLLCCRELASGSSISTDLPIQKAAKLALESHAVSVVLAHNHPCGDAMPSPEDRHSTIMFRDAMQAIGVFPADHIIIAADRFTSMRQSNFFDMA
ncbi:MAG: hypothetical protein IJO88_03865 [Oscillospiraceae bacterium]|nr:hypothetical protein [Oscillospiraceae bacterium]